MKENLKIELDLSRKVVRNSFFNVISRMWYILITLFLTPYIIGHIGRDRFGIMAFVGVLTGYFGLLDFGVGLSFVKYISEFYAKKDYERINQVINTGLIFYLIVTAAIIILGFFSINPIISLLKIPENLQKEASLVFLLGFIFLGIANIMRPFLSIQSGLQRMDITNKIDMAMTLPNVIGTVFFIERGYGLLGLMINCIIIFSIKCIVHLIINYRLLPELKFNPLSFSNAMFKRIFNYGYKLEVAYLCSLISLHFDKLLISHFLSIGLVTFYQLGSTIVGTLRSMTTLLVPPLLPAFSEIYAKEQRAKLIDGYTKGTKYFALFVIPVFSFMIICAYRLMIIWMGYGFEKSAWIIQILGFGWLFAVLAGIASAVAQAIARTDIDMKSAIIGATLNVFLSIILIKQFGFAGVAFGTMISLFCFAAYYFIKFHKIINFPLGNFLKITIWKPMVICLCIGLPVWKLDLMLARHFLNLSRIDSLIILCIEAIIFLGLYLIALLFIKPLDNSDRVFFRDKFPFAKYLIIRISR